MKSASVSAGLGVLISWVVLPSLLMVQIASGAEAASGEIVLPLERTTYVVGETIPLAPDSKQAEVTIELAGLTGPAMPLYHGRPQPLIFKTDDLAPGDYVIRMAGAKEAHVTLVSATRSSSAVLIEESAPFVSSDGKRTADSIRKDFTESGVNVLVMPGIEGSRSQNGAIGRRMSELDIYLSGQAMAFMNPNTRPLSFNPARAWEPEMQSFHMRLAHYAAANARYPSFGGFWYDWDGASMFKASGLLQYFGVKPELLGDFRKWSDLRDQAIGDAFKQKTGLEPVSDEEYLRYCLAIKRPEFAPSIDYPTAKWIDAIGAGLPPMSAEQVAATEKRLDAWSDYVMHEFGRTYASHQAYVRSIMPSLKNSASLNIDHGAVRTGHWHPAAYEPLDFRCITAWNDQAGGPDYTFQWLFTAGVLDIGRKPGQPTWMPSVQGTVYSGIDYPGRFMRAAGENLAYGGYGLGFAFEGFSNVLSSMNAGSLWVNIKGKGGEQDVIAGREFLKRFVPLASAGSEVRRVAILYSQRQMGRQHLTQGMDTSMYNAFIVMARLGYTPHFITEEEIDGGELKNYSTLTIFNQSVPLNDSTLKRLGEFAAKGGRLLVDHASTVKFENSKPIDIAMPYRRLGAPTNMSVTNSPTLPTSLLMEERYKEYGPLLHAALGDGERSPLMTERAEASLASTYAIDGGPDAKYVIVANDAIKGHQSEWYCITERLVPQPGVEGVLYDLTAEQKIGAVAPASCELRDTTVRVYGILRRPVAALDVCATQHISSPRTLGISAVVKDDAGKTIAAAVPVAITLTSPDGAVVGNWNRSTDVSGVLSLSLSIPSNVPAGKWTLRVRSLLDGTAAELPVTIDAAKVPAAAPLADAVIVRNKTLIEAFIAKKPDVVVPVFAGPHQGEIQKAAEVVKQSLSGRGMNVDVRANPASSTYLLMYVPDAAALAENARADRGETIGTIKRIAADYIGDYQAADVGLRFGKAVIVLDIVAPAAEPAEGEKPKPDSKKPAPENPLADRLAFNGMLWPKVTEAFPGPGRATVQLVSSAFAPGVDAIVIQATDAAGLEAGAKALAVLPEDWVGTSVERARLALVTGLGVGVAGEPNGKLENLTAEGARQLVDRKPFVMSFPTQRPPMDRDVKPYQPPAVELTKVPGEPVLKTCRTAYLLDGKLVANPHTLTGDARFFDAITVAADVEAAGRYAVSVDGLFRYSDREPGGQGVWDAVLELYKQVPKQRKPMEFEVWIDGKVAGKLTSCEASEQEVITYANPKKTEKEEAVTRISGTIELPAGRHDVTLIHHNVVDGRINAIHFTKP